MRKILFLLLTVAIFASCNKNNNPTPTNPDPVDTLLGRDAFIGAYSFNNTYEHVKYVSDSNFDTLRGTKTYEMRIEKPSPDDLGADAVVIRSFWAEFPSTSWPIIARVSTDGKSLHFRPEDNDGELNITTFDAKLNNDKSIDFNYFRYRLHVTNMGYEKGNGKATRL